MSGPNDEQYLKIVRDFMEGGETSGFRELVSETRAKMERLLLESDDPNVGVFASAVSDLLFVFQSMIWIRSKQSMDLTSSIKLAQEFIKERQYQANQIDELKETADTAFDDIATLVMRMDKCEEKLKKMKRDLKAIGRVMKS